MTATQPSRTLRYVAPVMLAIAAAATVANWYFEPGKAAAWAVALGVMTGMALVLWLLPRSLEYAAATRGWSSSLISGVDSVRSAVIFASLMLLAPLTPNLVESLGLGSHAALDALEKRGTMVLIGLFIVLTGNAMPKTLAPLSASQCDGVKSQSFQRFFGWTWTLMGLAYAIAWLTLPIAVAGPVSMTLMMGAILIVATAMIRLWRTHRRDRTNSPARP